MLRQVRIPREALSADMASKRSHSTVHKRVLLEIRPPVETLIALNANVRTVDSMNVPNVRNEKQSNFGLEFAKLASVRRR